MKKLWIVGSGRSGTTWVQNIFAGHPDVVTPGGETKLFNLLGPYLGMEAKFRRQRQKIVGRYKKFRDGRGVNLLDRYVVTGKVYQHRHSDAIAVDTIISADAVSAEDAAITILNRYISDHGKGATFFVEKTPRHLEHAEDILEWIPDSRILCIVRDGRDVCVSLKKAAERGQTWADMSMRQRCLLWRKAARKTIALKKTIATAAFKVIKYELLLEQPLSMVSFLFELYGLNGEVGIVQSCISRASVENLKNRQLAVYKATAGCWKDDMTEKEQRVYKRLCGKEHAILGYGNL